MKKKNGELRLPVTNAEGAAPPAPLPSLPASKKRGYLFLAFLPFLFFFLLALWPGGGRLEVLARRLKLKDGPAEEHAAYFAETQYQILTVTEEPGNPNHRAFYQDKLRHSEVDLGDLGDLKYPYMRIYDALVNKQLGKNAEPVRLLLLGGGGYVYPNYLYRARPGSEIVVVEIDPGVTLAARKAFGLPVDAPIEIHHMDARNYVAESLRRNFDRPDSVPLFDVIICDSVSDYSVPYQLTTREFMEQVRGMLKPDGIYLMNLIDAFEVGAFMNAIAQTFEAVFPFYGAVSAVRELGERNTTVFVGANQPVDLSDLEAWTTRPDTFQGLMLTPEHFHDLRERNGTRVLTDDWAPVENLLAPIVKLDKLGMVSAAIQAGIRAAEKQDYPRAIHHFQRAVEIAPGSEAALENLAHAQELLGEAAAALNSYAVLVQLFPLNVNARNRAAMILARQGHIGPALVQWEESLNINPAQPNVLNNLGALAIQQGEKAEAIRYWKKALEYAPGEEILLRNLSAVQALP
ncbi:MAG: fused MFS/spermidine synthase [Verrucomicrobiota bacterium]|jgi:spermidine synthase/Flp pilus assembly protein TadD|nr:fused MFS/spermidine synthase [Verrucomicrobiota bacterium]